MEDIQEIVKSLLKKGYYQKDGHYYGIYNIDIYQKELGAILNESYDKYIKSFSFGVFRSVLYNWGLGSSLDKDFEKYIDLVKNKHINELRKISIFLPQYMKIKSSEISLINEFEKHMECYASPFIINSFHYSSYSSILNYLLYHNFEVTCLASQKFIDKYKCSAEVCSDVMNNLFSLKSKISFVCANDFDSLIQLDLFIKDMSLQSKKVILIFMDGNVGNHKDLNCNRLVNVNFLGKEIYVRKGVAFLAKILNLPIFNVFVDSNEDDELYIDIVDYISLSEYSLDYFIKRAYLQLEKQLTNGNYFKWECWLYIHSWIKKEVEEGFKISDSEVDDIDRFTYIHSGNDRYVFDSKYYLSHLISEGEERSKAVDDLSLKYILKNIIIRSL